MEKDCDSTCSTCKTQVSCIQVGGSHRVDPTRFLKIKVISWILLELPNPPKQHPHVPTTSKPPKRHKAGPAYPSMAAVKHPGPAGAQDRSGSPASATPHGPRPCGAHPGLAGQAQLILAATRIGLEVIPALPRRHRSKVQRRPVLDARVKV